MMGWGSGNIGGGGGGLNFSVKQYATANDLPSFARENTIAIISAETMTGWAFDAVAPVDPVEGVVWMEYGNSSAVAFNVAKKNSITIYPLSAKQYIGGEWVDVDAKSWHSGEWVDWWIAGTLFVDGKSDDELTGGWVSSPYSSGVSGSGTTSTINISADGMSVKLDNTSGTNRATFIGTVNKISTAKYSKLIMKFSEASASVARTGAVEARLYSDAGYTIAKGAPVLGTDGVFHESVEIDVSDLTGEYYIGFMMWKWNQNSIVSANMTLARLS